MRYRIPLLCGLAVLLFLTGRILEGHAVNAFCWLPATIAGLFFDAPVGPVENGVGAMLHLPRLEVTVGASCSGMQFFFLLTCLLGWSALKHRGGWSWLPAILVLAYGMTLFANSVRVVLAVFAREAALHLLGPAYLHSAHLAAGILVFLPLLIASQWLSDSLSERLPS